MLQYNYPSYITLRPWFYWSNQEGNHLDAPELNRLLRILPFSAGVGGHTTRVFLEYEGVTGKPVFYFTFLREPVSRYISHLNHQRQIMGIKWDLDEFLAEERFNNFQTIRIAGEEKLEKAKSFLREKFNFVGLSEHFDKSLLLLKNELGDQSLNVHYERRNITRKMKDTLKPDDLTEEQRSRIRDNNLLDIELYNFATEEIFPRYLERYSGDIESDLDRFQMENRSFRYGIIKKYSTKLYRNLVRYLVQPLAH